MKTPETIQLEIDKKAQSYAKIYSSLINDEFQRKRAYASLAALYAFVKYADTTGVQVRTAMTLFRNPDLNEKYEISDLYINERHLDVRIVTDGNAFLIPKIHVESGIIPDFYVVVKTDKNLQNAELLGLVDTSSLKTEPYDYRYYSVSFNQLISYEDFVLKVKRKKTGNFKETDHEILQQTYLAVKDNEADAETRNKLLRHLFKCPECRREFCCFTGFEMVSCNTGKYPDLLHDHTLDIIGAQNAYNGKYAGKEEIIRIDNDNKETDSDNAEELLNGFDNNSSERSEEEPVSDILDELFSIESAETYDNDTENIDKTTTDNDEEDWPLMPVERDIDITADDAENTQKIISDYDVNGEPVYSYVTSGESDNVITETEEEIIEQEDDSLISEITDESEIMPLDEESLEESDNISADIEELTDAEGDTDSDNSSQDSEIIDVALSDENSEEEFFEDDEIPEEDESGAEEVFEDDEILEEEEIFEDENLVDDEEDDNKSFEDDEIPEENESDAEEILEDDEIVEEEDDKVFDEESEKDDEDENSDDNDKELFEIFDEEDEYEGFSDNNDETMQETSDFESEEKEEETNMPVNIEPDEDDDEESEEDDDDEEDEDDDDDDEDYDDEDEEDGSGKKKGIKIAAAIAIILLLAGGAAGTYFVLANKNISVNNILTFMHPESENESQNFALPDNNSDNFISNSENSFNNYDNNNVDAMQINAEQNIEQNTQPDSEQNIEQNSKQTAQQNIGQNSVPEIAVPDENSGIKPLTESDLNKKQELTDDPNKAITGAFNQNYTPVAVSGINWNCTAELFTDKVFKEYLQNLDNTLKQNLKSNLVNISETPKNNYVAAKMAIDGNGNLQKIIISDSSGSGQIDAIVLQSIKQLFEGDKNPILLNNQLQADKYYLKVIIKF